MIKDKNTKERSNKKMFRKTISIVLAVALVGAASFSTLGFAETDEAKAGEMKEAHETAVKEAKKVGVRDSETVYFITDEAGNESQRIVSERGNLHYDGYEQAKAPLDVKIKYYVDGKEINPKEIGGMKGNFQIKIQYDVKETETGISPFLAISGIVFDNEKFTNVEVDHGKVIDDGNRQMVVSYGLPGVSDILMVNSEDFPEEINVTGETTGFELESIYTFASKEIFEDTSINGRFDLSQITSEMDKLTDGMTQINKGATALDEGLGKLDEGAKALKEGTGKLAKGATDLNAAIDSLGEGSSNLKAGSENIANASSKVLAGGQEIGKGTTDLSNGLSAVASNSEIIRAGANSVVDNAFNSASKQLTEAIQMVNKAAGNIVLTEENYKTVLAGLKASAPAMEPALNQAEAELDNVIFFRNGIYSYTGGVDEISKGATLLNGKVNDEFVPGLSALSDGANALLAGHEELNKGLLMTGQGATTLSEGTNQLFNKEDELIEGIKMLKEGAKQLADGTKAANESLEEEMGKIKGDNIFSTLKRVNNLKYGAERYSSFGNKDKYETVNFIFRTNAIKSNSEEKEHK